MEKVDIVIIGAGVIGLSVAERIARPGYSIYVLEKYDSFGQETSSRNSEVIHAGIYYEPRSLKARLCVEGNKMLYELCGKNNIPHRQTGKLIVATDKNEEVQLEVLLEKGKSNHAPGLKLITADEIRRLEPHVKALSALYSPTTGIIDSHSLMEYCIRSIKEKGADIVYNSKVIKMNKTNQGYEISVKDNTGEIFTIYAGTLVSGYNSNSSSWL